MSWSRRSFLSLPFALAACGFSPALAPRGPGSGLQGRVLVDAPTDRDSFLLVRRIEDRLGRSVDPAYGLDVVMTLTEESRAIDADGNIRRFNIVGQADYELRDFATGGVVASGRTESFTGYSATATTVATLAAERDAHARLATILADQIVTDLLAARIGA